MIPPQLLRYDQDAFPLSATVSDLLGVDDLTTLRGGAAMVTRQSDQGTIHHRTFYAAFDRMRALFDRFVAHIAVARVDVPYVFQAVPTLRVQLPDNLAVGEFHRDADYQHPDGEVNFWVPLTPVSRSTAVWVEPHPGVAPIPFPAQPGEVLMFDAVNARHGNVINVTGRTRVSFDFRCLPMELAVDNEATTINTGMRFAVGGYYSPTIGGLL